MSPNGILFIRVCPEKVLRGYYMPGIFLSILDIAVNKTEIPSLVGLRSNELIEYVTHIAL